MLAILKTMLAVRFEPEVQTFVHYQHMDASLH